MKIKQVSIKWKVLGYLSAFVATMLLLLWLFQIVFLDSFYKAIKTQRIKELGESISKNLEQDEIQDLINEIARQNEINVRIVDSSGTLLYEAASIPEPTLRPLSRQETLSFYQQVMEHKGSFTQVMEQKKIRNDLLERNPWIGPAPFRGRGMPEVIVYGRQVTTSQGQSLMIMMQAAITPVDATVDTLRTQLIYITAILLLLSLLLTLIISNKISKPIIKMNNTAKAFAKGEYDTPFEGKGYLEISELSDTLNYARKELSKVEALRRELIANISHDLRTPLTMITGYGEVIRDIPGENTPENVQIIIDEAKYLTTLVNDMLDISKLQSGTQQVIPTVFNLSSSIRTILKRYGKLTEQQGYQIKYLSEGDAWVKADEIKISQVVYNLINNALTYTGPDKKVVVQQKIIGNQVRVEVIDTGEGISPDEIPYIWDRYYKLEKPHRRSAMGTGLGLSIVKAILELHGANFGVDSEPNHGSTFWFELDLVPHH